MMKKVGSCYYVHKSNYRELFNAVDDVFLKVNWAIHKDYCDIPYTIIKYDAKKRTVSYIYSHDWDTANEPVVDFSVVCDLETLKMKFVKGREKNKQVYHHKWMFVSDNYDGFDVAASKRRSELLNSIPSFHEKEIKSWIGNQDYWNAWCRLHGIRL